MPAEDVRIPRALLDAKGLTVAEFAVLVALYAHADESGTCFPSLTTIAREARLSRRTVMRVLTTLDTAGFLWSRRRYKTGGWGPDSTLYFLIRERLARDTETPDRDMVTLDGDTMSPGIGSESRQDSDSIAPDRDMVTPELEEREEVFPTEILQGEERQLEPSLPTSPPPSPPNSSDPSRAREADGEPDTMSGAAGLLRHPHAREGEDLDDEERNDLEDFALEAHSVEKANSPDRPIRKKQRRGSVVPPELLPAYHAAEEKLRSTAEARGITWQFGREGRALYELVTAYSKRAEELGPLLDTWVSLTASRDRFFGGMPPTASQLSSLLQSVEAEHARRRPPRRAIATARSCPTCGTELPEGAMTCPGCRAWVGEGEVTGVTSAVTPVTAGRASA